MVAIAETFSGNLDDVRAFCAVVDLGSITQAAAFLHETKGSVSRRVARLETVLKVTLLARPDAARGLAHRRGLAFHAAALESLARLDDALQTARGARTVARGHLRVTASIDFGVEVLPDLVASFRARHPEITLELLITDSRLDLAANRVDLALRLGDAHPDSGYAAPILADLTIGLYAAPGYLARRPEPADLAALSGHDVVFARERLGTGQIRVSDAGGREERSPCVGGAGHRFRHRAALTLAGAGIGHIPSLVAAKSLAGGDLVRILPDWASRGGTLRAVTLAGRELPARVRLFREHVRTELARRSLQDGDAPATPGPRATGDYNGDSGGS